MKNYKSFIPVFICLLAFAIIFTFGSGNTSSQAESGELVRDTITVSGSADVMVVPDEVIITIGIETKDRSIVKAKEDNDRKVKIILATAKEFGIDSKNLQMDYMDICPCDVTQKYIYDSYYSSIDPANLGYGVRKKIVVTIKDLSKFEDFLTEVVKNGVEYVQGVEFKTSELRKYKDQARELAVKAAKEKAGDMASAIGQSAGKAVSITEVEEYYWSWYDSWYGGSYNSGSNMLANSVQNAVSAGGEPQSGEEVAPGQIKVRAKVSADFILN